MSKKVLKNAFKNLSISVILSVVLSTVITSQALAVLNSTNNGNSTHKSHSNSNAVPRVYDKSYTCSHLVYDYGVTISAQTHCGFRKYNSNIITMATQCVNYSKQIGQASQLENILLTGIEDFNELMGSADNKQGVCGSVLANYSEFVAE